MGNSHGCDPADLPQASIWPDIASLIDGDEETPGSSRQGPGADRLNEIWALVAEHPNVAMAFWAVAIAAKLDIRQHRTNGQIAQQLGVTEAALSKSVNYFCDLLQLPRPPALKSQAARASYSRVQKSNHWRDRNGLAFVQRHNPR